MPLKGLLSGKDGGLFAAAGRRKGGAGANEMSDADKLAMSGVTDILPDRAAISAARQRLCDVDVPDLVFELLAGLAMTFGIPSVPAELLAEDALIEDISLGFSEDDVTVIPADRVFN